jgi:predicted dehydrogenase
MIERTFTCGIVGYGYMGEIRKRVVDQCSRLELIGVSDTDDSKRQKVTGCLAFETTEELIAKAPDILFVCTPNAYSPEICVDAMNRGMHVFCEKPPGRGLSDIRSIMAAEKNNVKLMFGFNHRFHPAVIKAKAIVDSSRMGKVLSLRGLYGKSGGISFHNSWRNDESVSGGGILLDQGIHMLDLFCYFCGDFQDVKCLTSRSYWDFNVEDNAYVILGNTDGQNAIFHSSATLWKHTFRLEITLEQGYLEVEGLLSKSGSYGRERLITAKRQFEDEAAAVGNPAEEVTYFDQDLSWELEVEELLRCVDEDTPVTISSSRDAKRVMEIIDRAYRDASNNPEMP